MAITSFLPKNWDDRLKSVQGLRPYSKCQHYTIKAVSLKTRSAKTERTACTLPKGMTKFTTIVHEIKLPSQRCNGTSQVGSVTQLSGNDGLKLAQRKLKCGFTAVIKDFFSRSEKKSH